MIEADHQQSTCLFCDRRDEFDLAVSELILTECAARDAGAAGGRGMGGCAAAFQPAPRRLT
ncbi:MAG: hypothetical protein ACTFAL_07745 [Candidatus Electronema sp. V4]|uniref:hypothetical protein n=1 Tax=Candidatus Electronema sp. V4 TaxID=3454756 RepID=UPI0040556182